MLRGDAVLLRPSDLQNLRLHPPKPRKTPTLKRWDISNDSSSGSGGGSGSSRRSGGSGSR